MKEEAELAAQQHNLEQAKLKQQCIRSSMACAQTDAADKAIARFFYANALSFSAASPEASSIYRAMVAATKATPPSYVPPTRNKIGGELLDKCYDYMWGKLGAHDAEGGHSMKFGSSYVSDGWDC